jgi:Protein of unknown function (DUF1579)
MSEAPKPARPDLERFVGAWKGRWKTWVEPDDLHDESAIEATIDPVVGGRSITVAYTASIRDDAVEGRALVGPLPPGGVHMAWVDSWHTSGLVMVGDGDVTDAGFTALVPYVYDGEGWTWSTEYAIDAGRLVIRHWNEGPGVPRYLGVEAVLVHA